MDERRRMEAGGGRMIARIQGGRLRGAVRAVTSKSCAHRLLIAAALADAPTDIVIDAANQDIEATARCLQALGAGVAQSGASWRVTPVRPVESAALDCGESGATLRFLMPVAAALGTAALFTGQGRLPERPHVPLCEALRAHGAHIDSDRLPMRVRGVPMSGEYRLPGDVSSQYVSGLMLALPLLDGDSRIRFTTPMASQSYIGLTVDALAAFGVQVRKEENGYAVPGGQRYHSPGRARVEGDWSAAAFWLAANATGSAVTVDGLNDRSAQGDRAVLRVMDQLRTGSAVIDASDIPDLVPAIAAAAASLPGQTRVVNAGRLRYKECDRLAALAQGLSAMGARVRETEDGLDITGGPLHGARVAGFNDHRVVMALAIAALSAKGETVIDDAQAVSKSYPGFWADFIALGGHAHVEQSGQ